MKRVMQTILHDDPAGRFGNCLQAAVAALFELEIDDVPHFYEDAKSATNHDPVGYKRFLDWFEDRGLHPREVAVVDRGAGPQPAWVWPHLAFGKSPRGVEHAVIRQGFDIIHDPHPDGGGIEVRSVLEILVSDPTKLRSGA